LSNGYDRVLSQYNQSLLTAYAAVPNANGAIDCYTVFDTKQDHYHVMNVGWDGYRRVYGCVLHLDIMKGKIWIQQNMTEMNEGCPRTCRFRGGEGRYCTWVSSS